MSCQLFLTQLGEIISSKPNIILEKIATGINTDTRSLKPGEVFVALQGENFDGHNFIAEAIQKGAIASITNRDYKVEIPSNIPQFAVENTLVAYQKIAKWWRNQFNIPIIAVTGSVGKTTTKELIAAVLATKGNVLKSAANYNNEIGVPKTLFQLGKEHDYAVIEMAMRGRGEIALLTEIARPTVGVITNVGTAHIGRLGSEEAIAFAKCELLAEMPSDSIAVLNHDNRLLRETAAIVWQGETLTYGLEAGDIQGQMLDPQTLVVDGIKFPLPLPGRHNALNYLAALAVAKLLDIDWNVLTSGMSVSLPSGRSQRHQLPNDILVLDETYNAGLESMIAALHLLRDTPGKRHIAVLGTMKELGERSPELHHKVGEVVQQLQLDAILVLVDDPEAEAIATGASGIPSQCFTTHDLLLEQLQKIVRPGDRLLFKASNSVGLSRVVQQFSTLRH